MGIGVRCWDDVAIGVWVWCEGVVKSMWCREKDMLGATHDHARSCNPMSTCRGDM